MAISFSSFFFFPFAFVICQRHCLAFCPSGAQAVDSSVRNHFARFATLHRELFQPLKRPLMVEAEATGAPLARLLLLHYPDDHRVWSIRDQFLLGPALLVCPVLRPGVSSRACYVPEGT